MIYYPSADHYVKDVYEKLQGGMLTCVQASYPCMNNWTWNPVVDASAREGVKGLIEMLTGFTKHGTLVFVADALKANPADKQVAMKGSKPNTSCHFLQVEGALNLIATDSCREVEELPLAIWVYGELLKIVAAMVGVDPGMVTHQVGVITGEGREFVEGFEMGKRMQYTSDNPEGDIAALVGGGIVELPVEGPVDAIHEWLALLTKGGRPSWLDSRLK